MENEEERLIRREYQDYVRECLHYGERPVSWERFYEVYA